MATLVTFHAHPDDEAIACGGTMAKAAAHGHRVVVVVATKGENGEVPEGFLDSGEALWERRVQETHEAARILGAHRVEFLGYSDSGMMGTPENHAPGSFWTADVEEAAGRLASILTTERADVLTVYDANGTYGHPDHIQVHRVGNRAAQLAGTPKVYESVIGLESIARMNQRMKEAGLDPILPEDEITIGVPEETVTTRVDAHEYVEVKRAAMAAHASQIPADSFFLSLPPGIYEEVWGTEQYRLVGARPGLAETSLFSDLSRS
jgi:LmbE family N-acetylglucosaminyl deacetylase